MHQKSQRRFRHLRGSNPPVDVLHRGEFVRVAYRLGRSRATGVWSLHPAGADVESIVLSHGEVLTESVDPLGRMTQQRLANLATLLAGKTPAIIPIEPKITETVNNTVPDI